MLNINVAVDGYFAQRNTEDGPVEVFVEIFYICAEHSDGRRWRWGDDNYANAGTAKAILRHINVGTPFTDVGCWFELEPRYGSDSWGDEDEYALACHEADCFGEPRPRW